MNKNTIPNEQRSPFVTSGIRVGSAAATTRGFTAQDFRCVGECIAKALFSHDDAQVLSQLAATVADLLAAHPLYPGLSYE